MSDGAHPVLVGKRSDAPAFATRQIGTVQSTHSAIVDDLVAGEIRAVAFVATPRCREMPAARQRRGIRWNRNGARRNGVSLLQATVARNKGDREHDAQAGNQDADPITEN